MFNFFTKNTTLDTIIDLINSNNDPKIVFCDYNVLINNNILNEHTSMFFTTFKNFFKKENLLEFIIFSNTNTAKNMEDGFLINNLLDIIYEQSIFNISFFKTNRKNIDFINNIIHINNNIDQNDFLYNLCLDDFYIKPFNKPLKIYLILSSLKDVLDFILRYKIPPHVSIILYNTNFNFLNEYENKIFEFINNIIQPK